MARKIFPGASNNLDALCRRYNIDLSKRGKHGALLDAELLAEVFLEMNGGRQKGIDLEIENSNRKIFLLKTNSSIQKNNLSKQKRRT